MTHIGKVSSMATTSAPRNTASPSGPARWRYATSETSPARRASIRSSARGSAISASTRKMRARRRRITAPGYHGAARLLRRFDRGAGGDAGADDVEADVHHVGRVDRAIRRAIARHVGGAVRLIERIGRGIEVEVAAPERERPVEGGLHLRQLLRREDRAGGLVDLRHLHRRRREEAKEARVAGAGELGVLAGERAGEAADGVHGHRPEIHPAEAGALAA